MTNSQLAEFKAEEKRSSRSPYFSNWVVGAGTTLFFAALSGANLTVLFVVSIAVAIGASADRSQLVLTLSLGSLTLATTGSTLSLEQPYLLRFLLLSVLVVLNVAHPRRLVSVRISHQLHRASIILAIFLLWTLVSASSGDFVSKAVEASLGTALTLAAPFSAAFGRWTDRRLIVSDMFVLVRFLWVLGMIAVGAGLSQGFGTRWSGIHANPNTFAFMSALGFGMSIGLRPLVTGRVAWLLMGTFGLGTLASGSRGALVGSLLAAAFLLVRRDSRRMLRRSLRGLILVSALVVLLPLQGSLDVGGIIDRTFGRGELDLSGRQDRWDDMRVLIGQKPLTGHGLGVSGDMLGITEESGLTSTPGATNSYLTLVAEAGYVGAALVFSLLLSALRRRAPSDLSGSIAWTSAVGAVVAGLGHMIGESFIFGVGSPFPLLFWSNVVIILTCGIRRKPGVMR